MDRQTDWQKEPMAIKPFRHELTRGGNALNEEKADESRGLGNSHE